MSRKNTTPKHKGKGAELAQDACDVTATLAALPPHGASLRLRFEYGAFSSQGPRAKNDDAFCVADMPDGSMVAIVADGIGGAPYGEVYSKLACAYASRALGGGLVPAEAIQQANVQVDAIRRVIDPSHGGGSTLLVCAFGADGALDLAWVGDSRLAVLRAGGPVEWVNEPDRAPGTNGLMSAICMVPTYIYSARTHMAPGDTALLMTDGAWEYYGAGLAQAARSMEGATATAYSLAAEAGRNGSDNATVVAVCSLAQQGR